jgi:hypothetical protein
LPKLNGEAGAFPTGELLRDVDGTMGGGGKIPTPANNVAAEPLDLGLDSSAAGMTGTEPRMWGTDERRANLLSIGEPDGLSSSLTGNTKFGFLIISGDTNGRSGGESENMMGDYVDTLPSKN